jgi:pyruvate formate lyase activating enzyme
MPPKMLAVEAIAMINSPAGRMIGADRIFFSGGEPTIHLPYIEEIVKEARAIDSSAKVNFDTNGFLTPQSLKRMLEFTTSVTYDIKAYNEETHRALTGAPAEPVLRNAEYIARFAREKLWEFRILVIPEIVDREEIADICHFIASLDPSLPVCFLAFRPNFILDKHRGATLELLEAAVEIARKSGIENAYWVGRSDIQGYNINNIGLMKQLAAIYKLAGARIAGSLALYHGCKTHPRNCGGCNYKHQCSIKSYKPIRRM